MESLVITTRSFFPEKVFLRDRKCAKIEYIDGKDIASSKWRRISLPIYLLDLFSEAGINNIEYLIQIYNPGSRLPNYFSNFIKQVTDLINDDENNLDIDIVYNGAVTILENLRGLIKYDKFKEELRKCIPSRSLNNNGNTDDTRKYFLEDLLAEYDSLFNCYECPINKDEYPFKSNYRCFVIRSFKKKLSLTLGKKYFESLVELFGNNIDYLIHDYDYGYKLIQSAYKPDKNFRLLLFKHNKGDIFQILKTGSFPLLYLYVTFGHQLKSDTQILVTVIEQKIGKTISQNDPKIEFLETTYNSVVKDCSKVKDEIMKLPDNDARRILPSLNELEKSLQIGIKSEYSLCKMMFHIMKLSDYVLRKD